MNILQKSGFNKGMPGISRYVNGNNPFQDYQIGPETKPINKMKSAEKRNKRSHTLQLTEGRSP